MTGGSQPRKNCTAKQEMIETMAEFMLKYVMLSTPHTESMKALQKYKLAHTNTCDRNNTRFR